MTKRSIIMLLSLASVLLCAVSVLQVFPVFANVPTITSITPWTRQNDNHTILNITVSHSNYYPGHYVNWIQVSVDGVIHAMDMTDMSPIDQSLSSTFVVPYDMGVVNGTPAVQVQANCIIHGPSGWSSPLSISEGGGEVKHETGLFNSSAPLLSDVNLLIQIAVVLVLIASLWLRSRHKYVKHGVTMGFAVALHTVSILVAMVPSFQASIGLLTAPLGMLALVLLSHVVLGSSVEVLGLYLIGAWISHRGDPKTCFKKKPIMLLTLSLWAAEFILGVAVYLMFYPFT